MTSSTNESAIFDKLAARTCEQYQLSPVSSELLRLTENHEESARTLLRCLEQDAPLANRLLALINSRGYGSQRKFATLEKAVQGLGVQPLRWLVISCSLPDNLLQGIPDDVLARYWRHSTGRAVLARHLTRVLRGPDEELAFATALLQSIGVLALLQQLGEAYEGFLRQTWSEQGDLIPLEIASMGFEHRTLSHRMMQSWKLPDEMLQIVDHPVYLDKFDEEHGTSHSLAKRLHVAECMARLIHDRHHQALLRVVESAVIGCGIDHATLLQLLGSLDHEMPELGNVFGYDWNEEHHLTPFLAEQDKRIAQFYYKFGKADLITADHVLERLDELEPLVAVVADEPAVQSQTASPKNRKQTKRDSQSQTAVKQSPVKTGTRTGNGNSRIEVSHPKRVNFRLKQAVQRSRQQRFEISLAVFAIDNFSELNEFLEPEELDELTQDLLRCCRRSCHPSESMIRIDDHRWLIVFHQRDRSESVAYCREHLDHVRKLSESRALAGKIHSSVSVGVACLPLPSKNFDPTILIDKATGCLSAAQLSGGDTVKSIEV